MIAFNGFTMEVRLFLPTSNGAGVGIGGSEGLPKGRLPVTHQAPRIDARKLTSQMSKDLPVQSHLAAGHDDGCYVDSGIPVVGDDVQHLGGSHLQDIDVAGDDSERGVDEEERRLCADLLDHLLFAEDHRVLMATC